MLRVGLTGGAGAGKSTAAALLAGRGALVVDADALAREVVAPGSAGLADVVREFGRDVVGSDGALDRGGLAALVFGDTERRRALERITHPLIAVRTEQILASAPTDAIVVHDVPLLVEKRMGAGYHLVVVVDAPADQRVNRLVGRGLAEEDARARIASQASDAERRAAADVWVDNSGSADDAAPVVDALWRERLVPFERNVRERRPAPRSTTARLVPPDLSWPQQAARLVARVARVVGDRPLTHIGSTAVPGLPARDIVDLQLAVRDMADAETLRRPLEELGFPRVQGRHQDEEPAGRADKRVHAGADPGRAVHLHLRPASGWTARLVPVFAAWLRAHDDERDSYAAVKRRGDGLDGAAYDEVKAPWIRAACERAAAWDAAGRHEGT